LRFDFLAVFFFGTFFPSFRASESPIAIACLRLLTFLPERPLFKVPALRFFIARLTLAAAPLEYFRAMKFLPVVPENKHRGWGKFHFCDGRDTSITVILRSRALARRLEGSPHALVAHPSRLAEARDAKHREASTSG
jgi:hypothetical protein